MEGMIILVVLIIFILPLMLVGVFKSGLNERIDRLSHKIDELTNELLKQRTTSQKPFQSPEVTHEAMQEQEIKPPSEPEKPQFVSPVEQVQEEPEMELYGSSEMEEPKMEAEFEYTYSSASENRAVWEAPDIVKKAHAVRGKQDWEKFIGENLINKIGIGVLVLGIGFFVKYAIDKDWIGETFRVFIGILCGGILIGIAHRMRKAYKAFSSVLVGGGIAVLYFTIAIAFHEYQLLSQTSAFIVMVLITSFAVILAIAYDRIELAILAILGGFATPFMVSTGEGNYIVLFTYIAILNTGMLVLAYYKKWYPLTVISYVFTLLLYGSWLILKLPDMGPPPYMGAFLFATLFYIIFFLMIVINNIKESRRFKSTEIIMLISNTFLYYSAGMYILHHMSPVAIAIGDGTLGGEFQGLFTALVAVFNFIFAYALYRNKSVDRNLVYLLIGLVLTFLSLTAPVQLHGNHITLFWAAEAVLLLWLAQRSGIKLIRIGSAIVIALMCFSIVMDWMQLYGNNAETMNIIFNKAFSTSFVVVVSLLLTIGLLRRDTGEIMFGELTVKDYADCIRVLLIVCSYTAMLLELNYQLNSSGYALNKYGMSFSGKAIIIGTYTYLFATGLMLYLRNKRRELKDLSVILALVAAVFYFFPYNNWVARVRDAYLISDGIISPFLLHYATLILLLTMLVISLRYVRDLYKLESQKGTTFLWFLSFMLVFLSCAEADHLIVLTLYDPTAGKYVGSYSYVRDILQHSRTIAYPIIWGIFSFAFMVIGMRKGMKNLRIISLSLFFLTLVKLFTYDIRQVSEGGKIAAFIFLGILLLIVSFMYQRLKKLIFEDRKNEEVQM